MIDQPPATAQGIELRKNLFADLSREELAFEAAGDDARMQGLKSASAVSFNATQCAADQVQKNAWDLFADNGQVGVAPDFIATEPGPPEFLKPKNAALRSDQAPGGDKYIGAVPP